MVQNGCKEYVKYVFEIKPLLKVSSLAVVSVKIIKIHSSLQRQLSYFVSIQANTFEQIFSPRMFLNFGS